MRAFEWCEPVTLEEALADLAVENAAIKAGGIDLLDRLKGRLDFPQRLVSLRRVAGLEMVRLREDGGLELGASVTLSAVAEHPLVRSRWPALAEAADQVATPNVRNAATVGGNLLQRPRCWYFRKESFRCVRKGGEACFAQDGRNAHHSVLANDMCAMSHPSDLAVPLVAHGATVSIAGRSGRREASLESLFVAPDEDITREHRLAAGEILVAVRIPAPPPGRARFVKLRERESADWPLAAAAAVLGLAGERCTSASIVLGAAAPVPWRARAAEALLVGALVDAEVADRAARAALAEARPFLENRHKVQLLETALRRAVLGPGGWR
ncbi:MAG TPA: FAD binding domain-containing protein [Anaeromyxobacter sp.]|nr:FAD binding domain-containing protein [Anaeromyxobacter sp.]